jgi:hypothetical protein
MYRNLALSLHRVVALALLSGVAGCSSSSSTEVDGEIPDFQGSYSLTGTYDGRTGNRMDGSLVISDQADGTATAEISVKLDDAGNVFFALNAPDPGVEATAGPGTAQLAADGSFTLAFSGREVISGLDPASCCNYTFTLRGTLSGGRIQGTWSLTRDMPSSDSGTFTATP